MKCVRTPKRDQQLIQIVDTALANAARVSGKWLACRPGCTQCCTGVFRVNQLDALRLAEGMRILEGKAPQRAEAVRERAKQSIARLLALFPGDVDTGILGESEQALVAFDDFGNDEICPALSAEGLCELYEHRPMTCRVFGPPVRSGDGNAIGACELCYQGATDEQIAACEMIPDRNRLEEKLIKEAERVSGKTGDTIVAYCVGK
jgi:Fe-S-cluster containining protein